MKDLLCIFTVLVFLSDIYGYLKKKNLHHNSAVFDNDVMGTQKFILLYKYYLLKKKLISMNSVDLNLFRIFKQPHIQPKDFIYISFF